MKSKKSNQSNQGLQFHRLPDLYRLHHLEHRYLVVPDDPGRRGLQGPGGDPAQPAPRCGAGEGAAALPGAAGGRLDGGGVFGHRGWAVGVAKDQWNHGSVADFLGKNMEKSYLRYVEIMDLNVRFFIFLHCARWDCGEGFCFASYFAWRSQNLKTQTRMKVFDHCHHLLPFFFRNHQLANKDIYERTWERCLIPEVRQILATTLIIHPLWCLHYLGIKVWNHQLGISHLRSPKVLGDVVQVKGGARLMASQEDGTIWGSKSECRTWPLENGSTGLPILGAGPSSQS